MFKKEGTIFTGKPLKLVIRSHISAATSHILNAMSTYAWRICELLLKGYRSYESLIYPVKWNFLLTVTVSILLYECTTRMQMKCKEKKIYENNTRMLRPVFSKYWKQHLIKQQLYAYLPKKKNIQERRKRQAGHSWRSKNKLPHGVGRLARTYINQLCADTECCREDLPRTMDDLNGPWEKISTV